MEFSSLSTSPTLVINNQGVVLEGITQGTPGDPVLIALHGEWQSRAIFLNPHYTQYYYGFYLVAMDLRGHGSSSKPVSAEAYSLDQMAEDLAVLLETLQTKPGIDVNDWRFLGIGSLAPLIVHRYLQRPDAHPPRCILLLTYPWQEDYRIALQAWRTVLPTREVDRHLALFLAQEVTEQNFRETVEILHRVPFAARQALSATILTHDTTFSQQMASVDPGRVRVISSLSDLGNLYLRAGRWVKY